MCPPLTGSVGSLNHLCVEAMRNFQRRKCSSPSVRRVTVKVKVSRGTKLSRSQREGGWSSATFSRMFQCSNEVKWLSVTDGASGRRRQPHRPPCSMINVKQWKFLHPECSRANTCSSAAHRKMQIVKCKICIWLRGIYYLYAGTPLLCNVYIRNMLMETCLSSSSPSGWSNFGCLDFKLFPKPGV